MTGLIDGNNFFVSCELTLRPELAGRPVIVLGGNGGCVVAMSNEAKKLGVTRGIPFFKIRSMAEKNGMAVLTATHGLYSKLSAEMMGVIREVAGNANVYSIDEAFIDLSVGESEMEEFGHYLTDTIKSRTGLSVSLGISRTKTLAKLAARFAKKYPGYNGVCLMDTDYKIRRGLELSAVADIWGIGKRTAARLSDRGIVTAAQFADLEQEHVKRMLALPGERIWRELHGENCIDRDHSDRSHKSISCSRTFPHDTYDYSTVSSAISSYAESIARRMRKYGLCARELTVSLSTNPYHTHLPQCSISADITLSEPTSDTLQLCSAAEKTLKNLFKAGFGFKKAGVTADKLIPATEVQPSLFTDRDIDDRRKRLMKTIDHINTATGSLIVASSCNSRHPHHNATEKASGEGDL